MPDKNRIQRYIDFTLSTLDAEIDVIDAFHDVPGADAATNLQVRDVVGNKTDTVAGTSLVGLAKAIKAKTDNLPVDPADDSDIDAQLAVIDAFHDVPGADAATNLQVRDVVGNKTDTIAGTSLVGLAKAIKAKTDNLPVDPADESALEALIAVIDGYHDVPAADAATNLQMRDVIGNKTDTVAGNSLVALIKQIVADTGGASSTGTHTITLANGTTEITIATITPSRTGPFEFQLDVQTLITAAEGGTVTLRLKHKIDGTNEKTIDLATFLVGTDEIHPSVNGMVKEGTGLVLVTVQLSSAVTVDRACPYIYIQG